MGKRIELKLSSLVATEEFQPSGLMIKTLCAYLESSADDELLTPYQLLEKMGHDKSNWYQWLKKPLFVKWWNKAAADYHSTEGLPNVHKAIYRNALKSGNPSDRKLYLERFDPEYKPATAREHTFPGIMPPESVPGGIEGAVERSKANAERFKKQADQAAPEAGKADTEGGAVS